MHTELEIDGHRQQTGLGSGVLCGALCETGSVPCPSLSSRGAEAGGQSESWQQASGSYSVTKVCKAFAMGVVILTVASSRARGVGARGLVCYVRQVMLGAERVPGDTFCTAWPALAWPVLWGGDAAMLQCVAAVATDESAAGR